MSVAVRLLRRITDDELMALSELNPGYQLEVSPEGELIVTPTGSRSGKQSAEVLRQLANWNEATEAGEVFDSSTGFRLPDGSIRCPDASWVRRDRWASLTETEQRGFAPLAPDAVFEVASPTNTIDELRQKAGHYVRNGVRLVVLVDPDAKLLEAHRPGTPPNVLHNPHEVTFDDVLPGFVLHPPKIFQG
jgi:Uma2 family endonuclease